MGRIGGYQNFTPKSSRASTGVVHERDGRLRSDDPGSYDRNEVQAGARRPVQPFGKQDGYYVSACTKTPNTYVKQVAAKQQFFKATVAIDDAVGPFRIEFGGQRRRSVTSSA